jgi:hypothetical protein
MAIDCCCETRRVEGYARQDFRSKLLLANKANRGGFPCLPGQKNGYADVLFAQARREEGIDKA